MALVQHPMLKNTAMGAATPWQYGRRPRGLDLPNLGLLGLGNTTSILGGPRAAEPRGNWGRMQPAAAGKDTTSGHWELAGLILQEPFPLFPHGFPPEVIQAVERAFGRKVLGNRVASGTAIIEELGPQHIETGYPIVYTSADSVFQIAAHEEVIPVPELYELCRKARKILQGKYGVGRVIARPFIGTRGSFKRTANRRDFALPPPQDTILDRLLVSGREVIGIGKIEDILPAAASVRPCIPPATWMGWRKPWPP